jgi:hypothetical protein
MEDTERKTPILSDDLFKRSIADIMDYLEEKFPTIKTNYKISKSFKKKLWNLSDDLKNYGLLINQEKINEHKNRSNN